MRHRAARPPKLEDLFHTNLIVVFCGTAAGRRSAALKQYYAGRGNRFWAVLATTGLTPRRLAPSEYRLLPSFGIGLTDLVKSQSGSDAGIRFGLVDRAGLRAKVLEHQPRFLCFNGKRAAQEFYNVDAVDFGIQAEPIDATNVFVAPSTSGAARGAWDQSVWQDLAERVIRIRGPLG